ncbi:MAG: Nuclease [Candidatus Anoxychlamydiales bacterium]|nr:Nuclease [Candidatus Anoxychlamydiales bacterium]
MQTKKLKYFLFGFLAGITVIIFLFYPKKNTPLQTFSSFPILKKTDYFIGYDSRGKIPLWVLESLSSKNLTKNANRKFSSFHEDLEIYPLHKSSLDDYKHSGYDRGHLAPARSHSHSQEVLQETFLLSNICPQDHSLNSGLWFELEKLSRDLTSKYKHVDVISGPLFMPLEKNNKRFIKDPLIGENDVAVPTHFFKIIRFKNDKGSFETSSYILPNQKIEKSKALNDFVSDLKTIEKSSGLIFEDIFATQK